MDVGPSYQTNIYGKASVRGICPEKWHLPSAEEWQELIDFAGGPKESWYNLVNRGEDVTRSTNSFGFDANGYYGGSFVESGNCTDGFFSCCQGGGESGCMNEDKIVFWGCVGSYYWSSTELSEDGVSVIHIPYSQPYSDELPYGESYSDELVSLDGSSKTAVISVRCIKDEE